MTTTLLLLLVLVALPSCQPQVTGDLTLDLMEKAPIPACFRFGDCYEKYGGYCANGTIVRCRVVPNIRCGLSKDCVCCAECLSERCGKDGNGVCRSECWENEFSGSRCTDSCKCCEPCKATGCKGRYVGKSDFCYANEYVLGFSAIGSCPCCVACNPDDKCAKSGGLCVNYKENCPCGFSLSSNAGCNGLSRFCKCCVPCPTSRTCTVSNDSGICVPDKTFCNARDEYLSNEDCCKGTCLYCKTCKPDKTCYVNNGKCFKKDSGCGPGMVESKKGVCTSDACVCCVPNPCPASCNCSRGPNPGRCMVTKPLQVLRCNEYISDDKCIGHKCSCYKTCTPDELCSSLGGTCFRADYGCGTGMETSTEKATCNSSKCVCCVLRKLTTAAKTP